MKNLSLILIAVITLSSCSKNIITTSDMIVSVEKQDASSANNISLVINAEFTPKTFGENIEEFNLDIIITATPMVDVSSEQDWLESVNLDQVTETKTINSSQFTPCRDKMVYGLGHRFAPNIPRNQQHLYVITHEIQVR